MARKRKDPAPEIPTGIYYLKDDAPWGGFINIRLDNDHHDAFDLWFAQHENDVPAAMIDLLGQSMKIGFAYDAENQCFVTTLTGALVEGDAARYVMTTRAGTWGECLALAVWKHTELAGGNYRDFLPRTGTFRSWG